MQPRRVLAVAIQSVAYTVLNEALGGVTETPDAQHHVVLSADPG
jgi:hypothetical protein